MKEKRLSPYTEKYVISANKFLLETMSFYEELFRKDNTLLSLLDCDECTEKEIQTLYVLQIVFSL